MIIDLRYHITSLVAVFLALGIGILIGGAALGNSALQKDLNQIQENLAKLRNDQRSLEDEITRRDSDIKVFTQFSASVMPVLVKDRLDARRVAIIKTNPSIDARTAKEIATLLQSAGANVMSTTSVLRDPAEMDPAKLADLETRLGLDTGGDAASQRRALLRVMLDRIVNGPTTDSPGGSILGIMADDKLIETGGDYHEMVDILILLGGSLDPDLDTSGTIDSVLIDEAGGISGLLVAATEPGNVSCSYLSEYLKHPIIVVDDVDTMPGHLALVLALSNGKKGHYGIKDAQQLLPDFS